MSVTIPVMEWWPLFRPDRAPYVRGERKAKPSECVFCQISKSPKLDATNLKVFETTQVFVVLNRYPYNPGHLLVLPKRHVARLESLHSPEFYELFDVLKLSLKVLKHVYRPQGFNVGLNLGKAAGAGIPAHLHIHVVPRWRGDLNFFPLMGHHKVIVETLEQTWEKVFQGFNQLQSRQKLHKRR